MSLLDEIKSALGEQEKAVATITGQRGGGKVVARTLGGVDIILSGEMETGKACFYDRRTNTIMSEAPSVNFQEFGV